MKKQRIYFAVNATLLLVLMLFVGVKTKAQNATDFWQAFEKCTQISQISSHYPSLVVGSERVHHVMNHGITIPDTLGVMVSPNIQFEVLDKTGMMAEQRTDFFLIREARFDLSQARFDLVYYYNFNGTYDQFVTATITLDKISSVWVVTQTLIN